MAGATSVKATVCVSSSLRSEERRVGEVSGSTWGTDSHRYRGSGGGNVKGERAPGARTIGLPPLAALVAAGGWISTTSVTGVQTCASPISLSLVILKV